MKLSNIGSKIVNVGETIILPGKDATVSENWRKNDVVAFLVEKGYLAIVDETPATEEESVIGHLDPAQLSGMRVDDLKVLANELGIDTTRFKKKDDYVKAIAAEQVEAGGIIGQD